MNWFAANNTPAGKFFNIYAEFEKQKDEMETRLLGSITDVDPNEPSTWPFDFDDVTFDWYDFSFEFKNVTNWDWEPDKETLKRWGSMGFRQCWICYSNNTEKYYGF